jgi:hypothetical protein
MNLAGSKGEGGNVTLRISLWKVRYENMNWIEWAQDWSCSDSVFKFYTNREFI